MFAMAGLFFSGVSTSDFTAHLDRQTHGLHCSFIPGADTPDVTGTSGCHATLMSPYSSVMRDSIWGGIPVSLPGMALFAFLAFWGGYLGVSGAHKERHATTFTLLAWTVPLLTSIGMGYLANSLPVSINTTARWDDPAQSLTDRVRGYVDMNCAHCLANGKYCDYRPMRFAWSETDDLTNLGVCVAPADPLLPVHSHIVKPGNTEKSLLFYRISSVQDGVRMPLLGRTLVHEEGRQLIEQWINSLTITCN